MSDKTFSILNLDCTVNGKHIKQIVPSNRALLDFIRIDLGLTGTKEGCGEGECGACLVLLNGRAVNSCLMTVSQIQGKDLVTIEGIRGKDGGLHPLQQSFMKEGAVQCGFCIPGIIVASEALLRRNPNATLEDIKMELTGNLCRCTGYEKVLAAVEKAKDIEGGK